MRRLLLKGMAARILLAVLLLAETARADEFTPAQRDAIVQTMRDAMKRDPSILRDAIAALQADDATHDAMTGREAVAANRAKLSLPDDPSLGPADASATLTEFYDIRCPYCRRMEPALADLLKRDAHVRIVFKDLPILGPASVAGAKALLAAQKQGKYFELRAALMRPGPELTPEAMRTEAEHLGMDLVRFRRDADGPEVAAKIEDNLALARALNITGTPGIVIGRELISGALDLTEMQQFVADARR